MGLGGIVLRWLVFELVWCVVDRLWLVDWSSGQGVFFSRVSKSRDAF